MPHELASGELKQTEGNKGLSNNVLQHFMFASLIKNQVFILSQYF